MLEFGQPERLTSWAGAFVAVDDTRVAVATTTEVRVMTGDGLSGAATPGSPFAGLRFSADGSTVLAAPHRFNLSDWRLLPPAPRNGGPSGTYVTRAATWSPDGSVLIEAAEFRGDRSRRAPAAPTPGRLTRAVVGSSRTLLKEANVTSVAASPDGIVVAAGTTAWVWNADLVELGGAVLDGGAATTVAINGNRAAVACRGGRVCILEVSPSAPPDLLASWPAHDESATGVAWIDDLVVSCGWGGDVRVWDAAGQQMVAAAPADPIGNAYALATRPRTGEVFVSYGGPEPGVFRLALRR